MMTQPNTYPPYVEAELDLIRATGGTKIVSDQAYTYVLLALGERRTGGYSIEIREVDQLLKANQPVLVIRAKEIKPDPDAMVIQVLTYPTLVYRLPLTTLPIEIEWVRG